MRYCCEEFEAVLKDIESLKVEATPSARLLLNRIGEFVKSEYERHTQEAAQAADVD